ncbi:MAG: F0F1 ATP synthase subunit epsilon [Candidatus Abyssubacteria bacterium]
MRLKVLLPAEILIDREVEKVTAEAENGSFTLLPRHIDFVAALVPGILFFTAEGEEEFIAVDEGILIKRADEVLVSTRKAVRGPELGSLRKAIEREFLGRTEREKKSRSASAKIEADLVRRFMELTRHGR